MMIKWDGFNYNNNNNKRTLTEGGEERSDDAVSP
jgi:hypothetical protein